MKEFIEKLIGRLEEISAENTCSDCPYKSRCDEVQEQVKDETTDLCGATIKSLAISIVNQLAEEYSHGHFGCNSNGDRIRAQISTDEGLADFIDQLDPDGEAIHYCNSNDKCTDLMDKGESLTKEMCRQCLMDYLQTEAEE